MQRILRGAMLKKYKAVLLECKKSAKDIMVEKWNLDKMNGLSTEAL